MAGYLISQGLDFAIGKSMKLLPRTSKTDVCSATRGARCLCSSRKGILLDPPGRAQDKGPQPVQRQNKRHWCKDISILLISSTYREGINIYDAGDARRGTICPREIDTGDRSSHPTLWSPVHAVAGRGRKRCSRTMSSSEACPRTNLTMKEPAREQIKSKAVDLLPQTPPRPLLRDQRLQLVTTMKAVC
jgi:hypothetical protein